MTIETRTIMRAQSQPSPFVAFGARSVGARIAPAGYEEHREPRPMTQVFWFEDGAGEVTVQGNIQRIEGPAIVVYGPNEPHQLYCRQAPWSWRFWTMDGPQAYDLCCGFGLSTGIYPASSVPHEQFLNLERCLTDVSARAERTASALAFRLLTIAAMPPQEHVAPAVTAMAKHLDDEWPNANVSVVQVAHKTGMHRSQLTRLFTQEYGKSPQQYLTAKRIQHAQSLLKHSDESINDIAHACGFDDPSYFARIFRQHCGLTPLKFRRGGILD